MGALSSDFLPIDLAHDPDGRPHGPLANHTPEGDRLTASALEATSQIHLIRERGEASTQNPDAFEAKPALAWHSLLRLEPQAARRRSLRVFYKPFTPSLGVRG